MAYVTQSEIEDAFGADELVHLADRDGDGVADAGVVSSAIARATGVIDSYLGSRYTLPLTTTPDLVRECALAIVVYQLSEDHATDRVKDDYKQALVWLKDMREGKMDIGLTPAGDGVASSGGGAQIAPGDGAFDTDAIDIFSGRTR